MKVINWLFGSFFRTIGRTIAILLMGGLLYYILATNGVGISDLFLDNVKASTYDNRWINGVDYKIQGGTYANTSKTDDLIYQFRLDNAGANRYLLKFYQQQTYTNGKELMFNIKFRVNEKDEITLSSTENSYTCTIQNTYHEYSFPSGNPDIEFEPKSFNCKAHYIDTSGTITEYKFSLSLQYWFNNNEDLRSPCYAKANAGDIYTFTCPANQYNNINGIIVQVSTPFQTNVTIGVADLFTIETDTNQAIIDKQQQTNDAINNQTQQQQQQHQEMMNSTTTEAEDEGSSFFGNFTTEDYGGLNAIITAPLNTIRSLLNSSCTKLTLPLPYVNKNLELPCMNDIYTQHFGLFFSLYQTIILAIISYRCLRSIFFDIAGFTNPDDDRIEVMDL